MMERSTGSEIGQGLLVVGGLVLAVGVISEILTGGSSRETHLSSQEKGNNSKKKIEIDKIPLFTRENLNEILALRTKQNPSNSKLYLVESKPKPQGQKQVFPGGIPNNDGERKHPPAYYQLSKLERFKYRQNMAKQLITISKENIK